MTQFFAIFILSFGITQAFVLPRTTLTTDQGILEGVTLATENGYSYDVFYAIPFAEPPVGNLRFKAPQPAQAWEGIRDATSQGPVCFQITNSATGDFTGNEDCLYLNVLTPSSTHNKSNLPVMFWIHGGSLSRGSANIYDGKFLVEKDVVVVTTNYRPGFTGFMALSNPEVPGNAGLKDLVMALQWVQSNIQHFGGDPDKVTIFGESAGGALTHFLVMSPMAAGFFDKTIIQSGSSVNEWPIQESHEMIAEELFGVVGIHTNSSYDLLDVLWSVPVELLALIVSQIPETDGRITAFRPVIEGEYSVNAFITKHPKYLMENGEFNRVPTMSGFASQEGLLFINLIDIHNVETVTDVISDFSFYIPNSIRDLLTPDDVIKVMEKVRAFYFPDDDFLIERFIDLNSDFQFIKDLDKSTRIFSMFEPNTYYYQFLYKGAFNRKQYQTEYNYSGAAHADELGYIFDMRSQYPSMDPDAQDWLVQRRMVELWTNFAKFGNPTTEKSEDVDVTWEPVTEDKVNCLFIDHELTLSTNPLQERLQFWRDLENSYRKS